jgi:lipoyl(octanoyl) transferase
MKFIIPGGITPYIFSLIDMKIAYESVLNGEEESVFIVEHEDVLTAGLSSCCADFLNNKFDIYITERGGRATIHNPGQLVVYPIINLKKRDISVSSYVFMLERWMVAVVSRFGIESKLLPDRRGVWVGQAKIGFIGIKIKSGVTTHGLCLNVCNDLRLFDEIVPCGICSLPITSMSEIESKNISISEVIDCFIETCEL